MREERCLEGIRIPGWGVWRGCADNAKFNVYGVNLR
jgi:hypothetical protein